MKQSRRNHSASFKARIAKEALKGVTTIAQIAQSNELHPAQVAAWKKEMEDNLHVIFERKNAVDHRERELEKHCERLERKLGQVVVERDWLEKKCDQLGVEW